MTNQYALGYKDCQEAVIKALKEKPFVIALNMRLTVQNLPVPEVQVCNWEQPSYDDAECNAWRSDCGEHWAITEGKPSENNMKFCHGCGRLIVEHQYAEAGEEK